MDNYTGRPLGDNCRYTRVNRTPFINLVTVSNRYHDIQLCFTIQIAFEKKLYPDMIYHKNKIELQNRAASK